MQTGNRRTDRAQTSFSRLGDGAGTLAQSRNDSSHGSFLGTEAEASPTRNKMEQWTGVDSSLFFLTSVSLLGAGDPKWDQIGDQLRRGFKTTVEGSGRSGKQKMERSKWKTENGFWNEISGKRTMMVCYFYYYVFICIMIYYKCFSLHVFRVCCHSSCIFCIYFLRISNLIIIDCRFKTYFIILARTVKF